ncbi:hypothetical protein SEA_SKOG_88 [Gordonia phage Skog]|uniref:Uncharacterized protein n=1 Tax=Gordonia phage Skog TaxID=2704033 RepID=A0A6G6XKE9_9CAUD|nr:hypothetical protein KHQ85_gp088 [Gordonia phage Skog]QIG58240.1 hypothetical protein SEA_SKOG_88 [Gordonia phage Skog]
METKPTQRQIDSLIAQRGQLHTAATTLIVLGEDRLAQQVTNVATRVHEQIARLLCEREGA